MTNFAACLEMCTRLMGSSAHSGSSIKLGVITVPMASSDIRFTSSWRRTSDARSSSHSNSAWRCGGRRWLIDRMLGSPSPSTMSDKGITDKSGDGSALNHCLMRNARTCGSEEGAAVRLRFKSSVARVQIEASGVRRKMPSSLKPSHSSSALRNVSMAVGTLQSPRLYPLGGCQLLIWHSSRGIPRADRHVRTLYGRPTIGSSLNLTPGGKAAGRSSNGSASSSSSNRTQLGGSRPAQAAGSPERPPVRGSYLTEMPARKLEVSGGGRGRWTSALSNASHSASASSSSCHDDARG